MPARSTRHAGLTAPLLAATVLAAVGAAAIDAFQAAARVGGEGRLVAMALSIAVVAPLGLALGLAVRLLIGLLPFDASPGRLAASVGRRLTAAGETGRRTSASILTGALAAVVALFLAYRAGLFFMTRFHNMQLSAAALAVTVVGSLALVGLALPRARNAVDSTLGRVSGWLPGGALITRPWLWAAALTAAVVAGLIWLTVSRWQTVEAIRFGPVLVPACLAVCGYAGGFLLWGVRGCRRPLVGWGVVAATAGCAVAGVLAIDSRPIHARAGYIIQEYSWFARLPLTAAQARLDRDGDGFSEALAGGDCDDGDPEVYPGAIDRPGNGLDEDCSGDDSSAGGFTPGSMPVGAPPEPLPGTEGTGGSAEESPQIDPLARIQRRWNVLLVTVDTVRWDHLGYAGYHRTDISPHIDALAEESVVFESAYSPSTKTPTAIPPMLASRWPSEMGRTDDHFVRYDRENLFVAEVFRDAGYRTAASVSHWYFREPYGFAQGFDDWREYWVSGDRMERVPTSEQVADNAIAILEEHYEAWARDPQGVPPFFMWVHFLDPHKLYIDHEEFEPYGPESVDLYDGEIRFADHHLGRVLDVLRAGGGFEDTIIIVTSDHGEAFGEHDMRHHGWDMYEHQIRVPLLIRVPGLASRTVHQRVSLMDLVPTAVELTGAGPIDGFRGRSLARALATGEEPALVPIFAEMPPGPHNTHKRSFTLGDWKLIHHVQGNRYMLFNLAADPGELEDLWEREPEQAERMRTAYEQFLATQVDQVRARSRGSD